MVRLKAEYLRSLAKGKNYFNSNMVRLKGTVRCSPIVAPTLFQFQYGSIKSYQQNNNEFFVFYFNSNMVRLKVAKCFLERKVVIYFNSNMVRLKVVAKIRFFSKNKGL